MYDGLVGEYLMSCEIRWRQAELAHPRAAHQQELALLDARSARTAGRPSLPVRARQRVTRAWAAVAASVAATLSTLARDGSAT
jgi:hypothetical protein